MKKLLLLLLIVPMVSCSSDEDDVTIDPLIGTWIKSTQFSNGSNLEESYIINSNGTYIETETGIYTGTYTGSWSNDGTDFNLLNQTYSFTESETVDSFSETIRFASDFNSFEFLLEDEDNGMYIRQ